MHTATPSPSPEEIPQPTAEEIAKWRARGGVDLAAIEDPWDRFVAAADIRVGVFELPKVIYTFRCSVCGRVMRNAQNMEPMCTGPSWTDDHPPEVMYRVS